MNKHLLFLLLAFLCSQVLYAQRDYIVTHYTQNNGLPQNSINDLYWSDSDFLWLSTEEGLVRFDGNSFYTFNVSNTPFINSDRFRWILNDVDRHIYTVTAYGKIVKIEGDHITSTDLKMNGTHLYKGIIPKPDLFRRLVTYNDSISPKIWKNTRQFLFLSGQTFFLGNENIYRIHDSLRAIDSIPLGRQIQYAFNIGQHGYVSSGNRLFFIDTQQKKLIALDNPPPFKSGTKIAFFPLSFANEAYVTVDKKIYSMTTTKNGTVIHLNFITDVSQIVTGEISNISYTKREHTIAIGSVTNGLYILKPRLFTTRIHPNPGIKYNGYYAQVELNDSTLLNSYGDIFTPHTSATSTHYNLIGINNRVLYKSENNILWSCKSDSLIYQFPDKPRQFIAIPHNEIVNNIMPWGDSILVVTNRKLLIVHQFNVIGQIPFATAGQTRIPENWTYALIDKDSILIAFNNSIYTATLKPPYAVRKLFDYSFVRFMKRYGNWIIGTSYGQGIFVISGGTIFKLPIDRSQHLQKAHSIVITDKKQVFISTNNGLFRTTVDEIDQFISGHNEHIYYQYFDYHEGIDNSEFNGACYPSVLMLKTGDISFPNMSGLIWFKPDSIIADHSPGKRFYLNEIEIDGQTSGPSDSIVIPAYAEKIGLRYSIVYWQNPYNIKLDYRLEGFSQNWSKMPPPGQTLSFTNLPAGSYTLTIRAQTGFEQAETSYTQLYIQKLPKYYETIWFMFTLIVLSILVIIYLIYLYNNQLIKQNAMLERRVMERTKSLEKTNENLRNSENELKQSVNVKNKLISIISHDIVTPLKFISLVSKNFKSSPTTEINNANEVIKEIHHTSQRLFDNAQNILNWVRYQNNLISVNKINVSPYAIVEELCELFRDVAAMQKNQIINDVDMDDIIRTDTNILTIIIQNILSNAVKYTHSCVIRITSVSSDKGYTITIADDGQGISEQNLERIENIKNKSRAVNIDDGADGTGLGYIIIFELAELLNATVTLESRRNVGTSVSITF